MGYMAFKIVTEKLEPSQETTLLLEQNFSMVRGIHNHFVTKFQRYTDGEIIHIAKQRNCFPFKFSSDVLPDQSQARVFHHHDMDMDQSILESMIQIVGSSWQSFALGHRPRPMFKHPHHVQAFWIFNTHGVRIVNEYTKDRITIPGPMPIELFVPEGTFQGVPLVIKISRDKNEDYHITGYYEQKAKEPGVNNILTILGIRLDKAITKHAAASSMNRRDIYRRNHGDVSQYEMEIASIRMTILATMMKLRKKKRLNNESVSPPAVCPVLQEQPG